MIELSAVAHLPGTLAVGPVATEHGPPGPRAASWFRSHSPSEGRIADAVRALPQAARLDPLEADSAATWTGYVDWTCWQDATLPSMSGLVGFLAVVLLDGEQSELETRVAAPVSLEGRPQSSDVDSIVTIHIASTILTGLRVLRAV